MARPQPSGSACWRADGTIGDAAFQQIEQELDLEALDLQQLAGHEDQPGSG